MPKQAVIRIPVQLTVSHLFVVFFASGPDAPKLHELKARLVPALEGLFTDPVLAKVREHAASGLEIHLAKRDDLPPLPIGLLRHTGLDELDERKLENSALAVLIEAKAANHPPRVGLWAALAAAHAAAEMLNGTIFDPASSRVLKPMPDKTPLSVDGRIAVARHIVVPFSVDERGLGWMTTTGMVKFGLLDLEVRDVPPNLAGLGYLMNAAAQHLVDLLDRSGRGSDDGLEVPPQIEITSDDLAAAFGGSDGSRRTVVGLEVSTPSGPRQPPFLRLARPKGVKASHANWLFQALEQLVGAQTDLLNVKTSSETMQQAHRRAVAELARVKSRFTRGLRPGETLYVKHGFDAGVRGREYMWVVVNTWTGDRLHGQLVNNARDSNLRAGHDVDLEESEVFDWMLQLPHGEHEGAFTDDVARREGHEHGA